MNQIHALTRDSAEPFGVLKDDLCETMAVLKTRGIFEVELEGIQKKVLSCPGHGVMLGRCSNVGVIQIRVDNANLCEDCQKLKKQKNRKDARREKNWEQQVAPGSRTNFRYLIDDQLKERAKKLNYRRKTMKRRFDKIIANAERCAVDVSGNSNGNQEFRGAVSSIADHCIKNNDFMGTVKAQLKELIQEESKRETGDASHEVTDDEVKPLLDFIAEQLRNHVLISTGKGKQARFSGPIIQLCHAMFVRSPASFREHAALSPLHFPSESTLKKQRAVTKKDTCKYGKHRA